MAKVYEVKHSSESVAKKHISKIKKRGGKIVTTGKVGMPPKTLVRYSFKAK